MEAVNRAGGGARAVVNALARELPTVPPTGPLRILDLGSGSCDIPLALVRWARANGRDIEITCVDQNSEAMELGRSACNNLGNGSVTLEQANIFDYEPSEPFDYALASMVLHHFSTEEIGALLTRLRRYVRKAFIINDLQRSPLNYLACWLAVLPRERGIRHDALLSVRRGFTPAELQTILRPHDPSATVGTAWFCRILGIVRFDREAGE